MPPNKVASSFVPAEAVNDDEDDEEVQIISESQYDRRKVVSGASDSSKDYDFPFQTSLSETPEPEKDSDGEEASRALFYQQTELADIRRELMREITAEMEAELTKKIKKQLQRERNRGLALDEQERLRKEFESKKAQWALDIRAEAREELRADIERELRAELRESMVHEIHAALKERIRKEVRLELRAAVIKQKAKLRSEIVKDAHAEVRAELERDLRAVIEMEVRRSLASQGNGGGDVLTRVHQECRTGSEKNVRAESQKAIDQSFGRDGVLNRERLEDEWAGQKQMGADIVENPEREPEALVLASKTKLAADLERNCRQQLEQEYGYKLQAALKQDAVRKRVFEDSYSEPSNKRQMMKGGMAS